MRLPHIPWSPHKQFHPGADLPSWFWDNLKAIDRDFYLIWHPYRVLWDNIINTYEGSLEDPRYTIHREFGELNFGFVLTDNNKAPLADCKWHLWRWCEPHGWAHIVGIEDHHDRYLKLLQKRLYLQAKFTDRYGFRAWNHKLDDDLTAEQQIQQKDREYAFKSFQEENDWLMKRAMENFGRGHAAPTRPTKDVITSYPGQSNRSRIIRPLTDKEGGIYTG